MQKATLKQQRDNKNMETDIIHVPPSQEYADKPSVSSPVESNTNFSYMHGFVSDSDSLPREFAGNDDNNSNIYGGQIDESTALAMPFNFNEKLLSALDQLDARVEKFRKEALKLQEKRDFLLMSIELLKTNELLQNLSESEREEIACYIQRVIARLSTVDLDVRTQRDEAQKESLSQINTLIDVMLTLGDPVLSCQRCQMYLNACKAGQSTDINDVGPIDKNFESVLLGCTLDDQKVIKKRLMALLGYLERQIKQH